MKKQQKAQAFDYGRRAFLKGIKRMPYQDNMFLNDMIAGLKVGEGSDKIMKEWTKGWDSENLKA